MIFLEKLWQETAIDPCEFVGFCDDGLLVFMGDSFGDGWNGDATLTIGNQVFTLVSGGSDIGCYTGPMDVFVSMTAGDLAY